MKRFDRVAPDKVGLPTPTLGLKHVGAFRRKRMEKHQTVPAGESIESIGKIIYGKSKGFEKAFEIFRNSFNDLYQSIPALKKSIDEHIPGDGRWHISLDSIIDLVFMGTENPSQSKKMAKLMFQLRELSDRLCSIVKIRRNVDGKFDFSWTLIFKTPTYQSLKIRGEKVEDTEFSEKKFLIAMSEIEISDETDLKEHSQLKSIIERIDNIFPTVIKYVHPKKSKRLLICLPDRLNLTTFRKEYWTSLSKIHQDFYGKTYRGRSEKSTLYENCIKVYDLRERKQKSWKQIALELYGDKITSEKDLEKAIQRVRKYHTRAKKIVGV